ncbi:MAG: NirA family protein [Alphaproteobacteria bacterium]|nr:NirA family protein [Alphaproteobacteria bacterium]
MKPDQEFTDEQKQYLAGFASGVAAKRAALGMPAMLGPSASSSVAPTGPDAILIAAQDRTVAAGGTLTAEEKAKRATPPLDRWDALVAAAESGIPPKGTDIFLTKFFGLFYVAPAQDSFMCRLRIHHGMLDAYRMRGLARLAERLGGGYAHVTTRNNLQIREIAPKNTPEFLVALQELGLTSRGTGADNVRNITGSPSAGIDPQEIIDTRSLARALQHHILNHRDLYTLPRKFNIAFDGGGTIGVLEDTNDIGLPAVRVPEGKSVAPGVWFRLQLGGITGHGDFARDTGVVVKPERAVAICDAILRVFIDHGDRTDRRKARLKYLLDKWGVAKFLAEVEAKFGAPLDRIPLADCIAREPVDRGAHLGVHAQRQPGRNWIGVVMSAGRMEASQMRGLADIAEKYGDGDIRLTVWQNLLISGVADADISAVQSAIEALGLDWRPENPRGGLVACTGNTGCKFAASNTKAHAEAIATYLETRVAIDMPVNIHLTGCHHSCAQHYVGDIGLIACRIETGEASVEGYHIHVGGSAGAAPTLARELWRDVAADEAPVRIERLLRSWQRGRTKGESFNIWANRFEIDALRAMVDEPAEAGA